MKQKYAVSVSRTVEQTTVIVVTAATPFAAMRRAMEYVPGDGLAWTNGELVNVPYPHDPILLPVSEGKK